MKSISAFWSGVERGKRDMEPKAGFGEAKAEARRGEEVRRVRRTRLALEMVGHCMTARRGGRRESKTNIG